MNWLHKETVRSM